MQTTVALFKLGQLPKEQVVLNYETTTKVANEIVAANKDEQTVKLVKETVLPFSEEIFGKSGAADCEVLEKIYLADFDANKDDIDYIKTMLRRLVKPTVLNQNFSHRQLKDCTNWIHQQKQHLTWLVV